jgi:glycosyltransferase involved in cell wall biosynthesis
VDVISPAPSGARYHTNFLTLSGRLRLFRLSRRYDRVVVQYHPFFFFGSSTKLGYLGDILGLLLLFNAGRRVEVYVHEVDYAAGSRRRLAPLWRRVWRTPERVFMHTAREHTDMVRAFGLDQERAQVVRHGESFIPRAEVTRSQARRILGVDVDAFVFLCIGFLQGHKGFDRAVHAFAALEDQPRAHLYVVGSIRVPNPEHSAYVNRLHHLIDETPGAHLCESFVSDARFDLWILAADVVVLPYREIWSSSVIERAALLKRPAIVTDVGGLAHQARDDTTVVRDENELIAAMATACGARVPAPAVEAIPSTRADAVRWVAERGHRMWLWEDPMAGVSRAVDLPADRERLIEPLPFPLEPNATGYKRLILRNVSRLTRWQLMPVISYINRMRDAFLLDEARRRTPPPPQDDV